MNLLEQTTLPKKHVIAGGLIFFAGIIVLSAVIWLRISPDRAAALGSTSTWTDASGNGNWNTAANWSGGSVPGVSTIVVFSASSTANCAINAAVNVGEITIGSGYTGTITQGGGESMAVGTGGFLQSAGTFVGSSGTSTNDGITVSGPFSLGGGTFTNTAGVLTLDASSTFSGTFNPRASTVVFQLTAGKPVITGPSAFYDLEFTGSGNTNDFTIATGTTLTAEGYLFLSTNDSTVALLGGGTVDVQGNIEASYAPNIVAGTASIVLDGTSTQLVGDDTMSGHGDSDNVMIPNLTIQKTAGTVAFAGDIYVAGNFTNTNGTTINPGTSTVVLQLVGNSTSSAIVGSSTFYGLEFAGNGTTDGAFTIATGTTLTTQGYLFLDTDDSAIALLGGGTINDQGNVEAGYYPSYATGTVSVALDGTSTQIVGDDTVSGVDGTGVVLPDLTITKTAGTVALSGAVQYIGIAGNFANTNGTTINPGTSTIVFGPSQFDASGVNVSSTFAATISGSSTFYNLVFGGNTEGDNPQIAQYTIATGTVITAQGYFFPDANDSILQLLGGGAIDAQGNIEAGYDPVYATGTASLVLDGTSTQLVGDDTISGHGYDEDYVMIPNLTIQKTTGTVALAGGVFITGNFTNVNGTAMDPGTSTTVFGPNNFMSSGVTGLTTAMLSGSSTFYNLILGADTRGNDGFLGVQYTIATGTVITAQGYFFPDANYSTLQLLGGGAIDIQGNIEEGYNPIYATGTASLVLDGTSTQLVGDDSLIEGGDQDSAMIPDLTVAKSAGVAYAENQPFITGPLTVSSGELQLSTSTSETTMEVDGPVTVSSGALLTDYPQAVSTLLLGSSLTNNGVIFFDGSADACTEELPNDVVINSTTTGQQVPWYGSGKFFIRYANVEDQGGTAPITVWDGTDSGDDGANWTFSNGNPVPELIQTSTANGGAGTTQLTLPAFGFAPRAGDMILVAVSARNQSIIAPTDNASNTYTLVSASSFGSSPSYAVSLYYAKDITTTSSFAVTVNGTGGSGAMLSANAFEYTGINPSSTLDQYNSNTDTSGSATSLTSFPVNGQAANELYFGALTFSALTTASSGSGWTPETTVLNSATTQGLYDEDVSSISPLSIAATWTAATSTSYSAVVGVFHSPYQIGYVPSGMLDSATFDTRSASGTQLNSVTWTGSAPGGSEVGFQFAVSNSPSGPWNFEGPSGDGTTYFYGDYIPGDPIPLVSNVGGSGYSMFSGFRYFRYRVALFSDPTHVYTPTVTGVSVNWSP